MNKKMWLPMSTAERWIECTGSIEPNTDETRSYAGEEEEDDRGKGEKAHKLAYLKISGKDAKTDDGEMMNAVNIYVNELKKKHETIHPELYVEYNGCRGYIDALAYNSKKIFIYDFKYGKNKKVQAKENAQLRLYALGAANAIGMEARDIEIETWIIQPRMNNNCSEILSLTSLENWYYEKVFPAQIEIFTGSQKLKPGSHCQFCSKFKDCFYKYQTFRDIDSFKKSETLSTEDKNYIRDNAQEVRKWLDSFERDDVERAIKNGTPDGYVLEPSRTDRAIRSGSEEAVINELIKHGVDETDIFKPRQMRGLNYLEYKYGKELIDEAIGAYIEKVERRPKLKRIKEEKE